MFRLMLLPTKKQIAVCCQLPGQKWHKGQSGFIISQIQLFDDCCDITKLERKKTQNLNTQKNSCRKKDHLCFLSLQNLDVVPCKFSVVRKSLLAYVLKYKQTLFL